MWPVLTNGGQAKVTAKTTLQMLPARLRGRNPFGGEEGTSEGRDNPTKAKTGKRKGQPPRRKLPTPSQRSRANIDAEKQGPKPPNPRKKKPKRKKTTHIKNKKIRRKQKHQARNRNTTKRKKHKTNKKQKNTYFSNFQKTKNPSTHVLVERSPLRGAATFRTKHGVLGFSKIQFC